MEYWIPKESSLQRRDSMNRSRKPPVPLTKNKNGKIKTKKKKTFCRDGATRGLGAWRRSVASADFPLWSPKADLRSGCVGPVFFSFYRQAFPSLMYCGVHVYMTDVMDMQRWELHGMKIPTVLYHSTILRGTWTMSKSLMHGHMAYFIVKIVQILWTRQ